MDVSDEEEDQIIYSYWRDIPDKFSQEDIDAFRKDNSFVESEQCKKGSQHNKVMNNLSSMIMDYWIQRIATEKQILLSTIKSEMISIATTVEDLTISGYHGRVSILDSDAGIMCVYNGNSDDEKKQRYCKDRKEESGSEQKTALVDNAEVIKVFKRNDLSAL